MIVSFGALALHFTAIGFTTTIIKILVTCATPLLALGLRNTAGGIVLILASMIFSSKRTNLLKYIPKRTILGATFRVLIPSTIGYWAMQYVSAAKFAFFYNLCPFVTYILSYFILGELMTRRKLLGMSVAFAGTIPILMTATSKSEQELVQLFSVSLPEVGIVIIILSLCYGSILMRQLVIEKEQYSILAISGYDSLLGGGVALICAYILPLHQEMYKLSEFILWGGVMTLVAGFFVRPIYAWLLRSFSPTFLAIGSLSVPFSTAFFSWLYFGQGIGLVFYLSTVTVLIGSLIFYSEERRLRLNGNGINGTPVA